MLTTRPSLGLTLLVLIVYTSKLNIVVAKLCESEDGQSSKECDDDEECCESDDGEAKCCEDLGVVGILITLIMIGAMCLTTFICCVCCYKWRKKQRQAVRSRTVLVRRTGTNVIVRSGGSFSTPQGTRTVLVSDPSNNRNVTMVEMKNVNDYFNTNGDAPPPYSSDDAPPSYAEIDL